MIIDVLQFLGIFACALLLEVGWVFAVDSVGSDQEARLVGIAVGMQTIAYAQTLILVSNNWTMLAGVLGSGLGALIGLRAKRSASRRAGPTG